MEYVALIQKVNNLHIGTVPDVPGCVAIAPTYVEAQRRLMEAIAVHTQRMQAYGDLEQPIYKACTISANAS